MSVDLDLDDEYADSGYPPEAFDVKPIPMPPGMKLVGSLAYFKSPRYREWMERRRRLAEAERLMLIENRERYQNHLDFEAAKKAGEKPNRNGARAMRRAVKAKAEAGQAKPRRGRPSKTWISQGIAGIETAPLPPGVTRWE